MSASLVNRAFSAWGDLRGSMARQLSPEPEERELLFWLYLACGIGFLAGLPAAFRQAAALSEPDALLAVISARIFAAIFLAPLIFYGIAALSHLIARAVGGKGTWRRARAAFFWSLLVSIPLLVIGSLFGAMLTGAAGILLSFAVSAGFFWVWASFLAEAEGFARTLPVFAAMVAVPVVLAILRLSAAA